MKLAWALVNFALAGANFGAYCALGGGLWFAAGCVWTAAGAIWLLGYCIDRRIAKRKAMTETAGG